MKSLSPVLRLIAIGFLDIFNAGLHPLSPYTGRAVIVRNNLERPM